MTIDLDLRTEDNRTIDAMAAVIRTRVRELGETTRQACTALAINVLKSLRADTKIANEKSMSIKVTNVDGQYSPSWKRERGAKGQNVAKRILRAGPNGNEVTPDKGVFWDTRGLTKKIAVHCFHVLDHVADGKDYEYYIVTSDMKRAKATAKKHHQARVRRFKNLAKFAMGLAMNKVHNAEQPDVSQISNEAINKGKSLVAASVHETGLNSGDVNIHVEDNLGYASYALKHGEAYVQTAIQKALNGMTAYLKNKIKDKKISDSLQIPFPDIKGKVK